MSGTLGLLSGVAGVVAEETDTPLFLGQDLLAWLVLALGGAMAVGSVMAIVRPPEQPKEGDLAHAPIGRSVTMAIVGALAAIWAVASLIAN